MKKSFRSSILLSDDPFLKTKRDIKSQLHQLNELSQVYLAEKSVLNNYKFNRLYVELEGIYIFSPQELLRASRKKRPQDKFIKIKLLALFQQRLKVIEAREFSYIILQLENLIKMIASKIENHTIDYRRAIDIIIDLDQHIARGWKTYLQQQDFIDLSNIYYRLVDEFDLEVINVSDPHVFKYQDMRQSEVSMKAINESTDLPELSTPKSEIINLPYKKKSILMRSFESIVNPCMGCN